MSDDITNIDEEEISITEEGNEKKKCNWKILLTAFVIAIIAILAVIIGKNKGSELISQDSSNDTQIKHYLPDTSNETTTNEFGITSILDEVQFTKNEIQTADKETQITEEETTDNNEQTKEETKDNDEQTKEYYIMLNVNGNTIIYKNTEDSSIPLFIEQPNNDYVFIRWYEDENLTIPYKYEKTSKMNRNKNYSLYASFAKVEQINLNNRDLVSYDSSYIKYNKTLQNETRDNNYCVVYETIQKGIYTVEVDMGCRLRAAFHNYRQRNSSEIKNAVIHELDENDMEVYTENSQRAVITTTSPPEDDYKFLYMYFWTAYPEMTNIDKESIESSLKLYLWKEDKLYYNIPA